MAQQLELYVLHWGLYPRRVLIYLAEKGLLNHPLLKITPVDASLDAPGKPKGTTPILRLPDNTYISQSVAILEYLEDLCESPVEPWQKQLAADASTNDMRGGPGLEARARVRSILGLADEATALFGFACHMGSQLFVGRETLVPEGAAKAVQRCRTNLKLLDEYYADEEESGSRPATIADCVLFSLLQFAVEFYQKDLLVDPDLPHLGRFYNAFKERESAKIEQGFYPEEYHKLAGIWLF